MRSMLLPVEQHVVFNTVIPCIDNGTAEPISGTSFRDGNEDEIRVEFFHLWGRVIRSAYDGRSTRTEYQFVGPGEELERLKRMVGK